MDITVKKHEHRHLAMSVCEHKYHESYVDFVSTTCMNMCQVKSLESFKGGYHPIIPHHNHFNSMLARKVNHYKLIAN